MTQATEQWAATATASSQYGDIDWAARQATGAPDMVACDDDVHAWAFAAAQHRAMARVDLHDASAADHDSRS